MLGTRNRSVDLQQANLTPRRTPPVVLWAAVGIAFLALQTYIYSAWIGSGDATPTSERGGHVSDGYRTFVTVWEIGNVIVGLLLLYFVVYRPWRRNGRMSLDGILSLVFLTLVWQDPISDYMQTAVTYTSVQTNLGSWATHIPGWYSPHAEQYGWPIAWGPPAYMYFWLASVVAGGILMQKTRQRWPRASRLELIIVCYFTMAIVDLIGELIWVRSGLYTFIGPAYPKLTMFYGHYYQFPIYETMMLCLPMTAITCLRFFKNDRGQTLVERGSETLTLSAGKVTFVRFLALVGICNVIYLGMYNLPMQWFGVRTTAPVEDVLNRPELLNGVCGPGTDMACPGPNVPLPRPGAGYVNNEGVLVTP